jgi:hypothetical protein
MFCKKEKGGGRSMVAGGQLRKHAATPNSVDELFLPDYVTFGQSPDLALSALPTLFDIYNPAEHHP